MDIKTEAERLITEAITTGSFTLTNGLSFDLTPTQILSIAKKYLEADEIKRTTQDTEPDDISMIFGE